MFGPALIYSDDSSCSTWNTLNAEAGCRVFCSILRSQDSAMQPLPRSCRAVLVLCLALPAGLISPTTPPQPRFEVASIHPNTRSVIRWRIEFTPDGFIAEDASLADLIHEAWGSESLLQWDPLPSWNDENSLRHRCSFR
jgi:hypothetical protein